MKYSKKTKVSLRIIALFSVAIMLSIVPDYFHNFFADVQCNGNLLNDKCNSGYIPYSYSHGNVYHWGYRHWLYFFMGLCLAIVQIVNIIAIISTEENVR